MIADTDIPALVQMVYGEAAGSSPEVMKMIAQTAVNRMRSGRGKEFGKTVPEMLGKGYYAVRNQNIPYKQALAGIFNDDISKQAWTQAQQAVNDVVSNQDYGKAMFYFTPEEIDKLKRSKDFNFNAVQPTGTVGEYSTFGYPIKTTHYRKD